MDSIEALQAKYDVCRAAANAAVSAANEAKDKLDRALVAAMSDRLASRGIIPGAKVIERRRRQSEVGVFTGVRRHAYGIRPHVAKMKNDGTAHATASLYFCDENALELAPGEKQ